MSDAQDAARYRWLRDQHWTSWPESGPRAARLAVVEFPHMTCKATDCAHGDRLDTLIDALIKTESLTKGDTK